MKYTVTFFSLVLVCLVFGGSAQAACGGGGFKPTRDKPSAEINTPTNHSVSVSYEKGSSSREVVSSPRIENTTFSSRFDSSVNDLKVTSQQYNDISSAKHDIGNKLGDLQHDVDKASNKLARCSGDCDKERRKLEEAQSKLTAYDAKREFDRRVGEVLNNEQLKTYQGSK